MVKYTLSTVSFKDFWRSECLKIIAIGQSMMAHMKVAGEVKKYD